MSIEICHTVVTLLGWSVSLEVSKTPFCIVPWGAIAILPNGDVVPCVASNNKFTTTLLGNIKTQKFESIWEGPNAVTLRKLHHETPFSFGGCHFCLEKEAHGALSRRREMQQKYGKWFELAKVDFSNFSNPKSILFLDLAFSSLCNLTCTMCSSTYSSSWRDLDKKLSLENFDNKPKPTPIDGNKNLRSNLASLFPYLNDLRQLFLKGGEPFLNKDSLWFLEQLALLGISKNMTLAVVTNGTIYNREISSILSHFKRVELVVSFDAHGDLYRYIRGGEQFGADEVVTNVTKLKKENPNIWLTFTPTLQAYNVLRFSSIMEFCFYVADEVHCDNWVTEPIYQSVVSLPAPLYPLAIDELQKSVAFLEQKHPSNKSIPFLKNIICYLEKTVPWISEHRRYSDENREHLFTRYTKIIDDYRHMKLSSILPEMQDYLR